MPEGLLEKAHMNVHPCEAAMALIGIRFESHRPAELLRRSLMGEVMRGGPQQVATRQVGFSHVGIEQQRLLSRGECLLLQIPGLFGRDECQPRDVRGGQFAVRNSESRIERDRALEKRESP